MSALRHQIRLDISCELSAGRHNSHEMSSVVFRETLKRRILQNISAVVMIFAFSVKHLLTNVIFHPVWI